MNPVRILGSLVLTAVLCAAPGASACTPNPIDYNQLQVEGRGVAERGFAQTEATTIPFTLVANVTGVADGARFSDECVGTGADHGTIAAGTGSAKLGGCATGLSLGYTRGTVGVGGEATVSRGGYVIVVVVICVVIPLVHEPVASGIVIYVNCVTPIKPSPHPCAPGMGALDPARA